MLVDAEITNGDERVAMTSAGLANDSVKKLSYAVMQEDAQTDERCLGRFAHSAVDVLRVADAECFAGGAFIHVVGAEFNYRKVNVGWDVESFANLAHRKAMLVGVDEWPVQHGRQSLLT